MQTIEEKKAFLDEIDLFVLDMDGTFYLGDIILEGSLDFLKKVEESIKALISVCQEFGSTKEATVEKLMEKCGLSKEDAEEKVEKYW